MVFGQPNCTESPLELGDGVPKALPRTSNISVRVSTRFPSCDRRLLAKKFTPCSHLLPEAAFPGSSSWDALRIRSPKLSECLHLNRDFPRSPRQSAAGTSLPLAVLTCHGVAVVLPTARALGNNPLPLSPTLSGVFQQQPRYLCSNVAGGNVEN